MSDDPASAQPSAPQKQLNRIAAAVWILGLLVVAVLQGFTGVDPSTSSASRWGMWIGATVANVAIAAAVSSIPLLIARFRKQTITLRRVLWTYTIVWFVLAFLQFASWVVTLGEPGAAA